MLGIFGVDPLAEPWVTRSAGAVHDALRTPSIDALVQALLEQRTKSPPHREDFAAADAIRDRLKEAGIEIEDTPQGPRWTVERLMPGNKQATR